MSKEVSMFNYPYIVELLSPKRPVEGQAAEKDLDRFAERYQRILSAGLGLSIPDNPMGQPRMGALESIGRKRLTIRSNRIVMNLNTFHTRNELYFRNLTPKASVVREAWRHLSISFDISMWNMPVSS
jgi:hypothetical protein